MQANQLFSQLAGYSNTTLGKIGLGYLGAINIGSFALFYHDKNQALSHGWRVPEKTLQLSALLGGWIGGMIAMEKFRHKTKKESFRQPYFACVLGNVGLIGLGLWSLVRRRTVAPVATHQRSLPFQQNSPQTKRRKRV